MISVIDDSLVKCDEIIDITKTVPFALSTKSTWTNFFILLAFYELL